jgi:hypothetical protein
VSGREWVISDTNMSEVNPKDFLKVVQSKYKQNPYGISGFAFWKVEEQIHRAVTYQIADSQILCSIDRI